jgi:hypothetical protein
MLEGSDSASTMLRRPCRQNYWLRSHRRPSSCPRTHSGRRAAGHRARWGSPSPGAATATAGRRHLARRRPAAALRPAPVPAAPPRPPGCALSKVSRTSCALCGITGDRTKVLHAQNDLAGFVRHGYHPHLLHRTPPLSCSALGSGTRDQPTVMNVCRPYLRRPPPGAEPRPRPGVISVGRVRGFMTRWRFLDPTDVRPRCPGKDLPALGPWGDYACRGCLEARCRE